MSQFSNQAPSMFRVSPGRSLVEDDDAHMKVALGYGDVGVPSHLQASKTGNTRFFTSNTHSAVVLQVDGLSQGQNHRNGTRRMYGRNGLGTKKMNFELEHAFSAQNAMIICFE